MQQPLVSVIMPTFNRETKIIKAIESVIDQSYANWELIVVDDKSTDNTKIIISEFSKKDNRIFYLFNSGKKGLPSARNCGMRKARGKYLAFLDSDDQWLNCHLDQSVSVLEKYNKEVCFSLWYEIINGVKQPIEELEKNAYREAYDRYKEKTDGNVIILTGKDFHNDLLLEKIYCYHINTMVFNRSIINHSNMFDEKIYFADDTDFTFKVIMKYGFCLIKEYHYEYYHWDDSMYAFTDRRKITPEIILKNEKYINRIFEHCKGKMKHYKNRKKHVKNSEFVQNKKDLLKYFNQRISKKFYTMGYLKEKTSKTAGLYYYLKSVFYAYDQKLLNYAIKSMIPFGSPTFPLSGSSFDFN